MEGFKRALGPIGLGLILVGGVAYGILYTSGPAAFLPLLLGLVLSVISIVINYRDRKTQSMSRSARFGINTGAAVIFLAAIMIFLQTLSTRHNIRLDTTANKRFSLSSQTVKVLRGLEDRVVFSCFFRDGTQEQSICEDLLREYRNGSSLVEFRFIDPDRHPLVARRYNVTDYGVIVAESGEREEKAYDITEHALTNTLLRVTRERKKSVCFITGHGENSIEDSAEGGYTELKTSIERENFDVRDIFLMHEDSIPAGCDVLVIAGPRNDIFPQEKEILERYLDEGGKALLLLDPVSELPLISELAAAYGIVVGRDIVVDRFGKLLAGNYLSPIVNSYGDHPITSEFRTATVYAQARSIIPAEQTPPGIRVDIIGWTGNGAYGETSIDTLIAIGKTQFEGESDLAGPVSLAVAASAGKDADAAHGTRLAVFGDSDFVRNANIGLSGNRDLVLNTINWLAEQEDLIAIRPVEDVTQPVLISARAGRVVFWLPVVGLPALIALLGISVAIRKRTSP
jgi:ABC-type uncharacterized transport system involved in gliding motility auxiliary subunit